MKIFACSTCNKVILTITDNTLNAFRLERKKNSENEFSVFTGENFTPISQLNDEIKPVQVSTGDFLDNFNLTDGLYEYRICDFNKINIDPKKDYTPTPYIRIGSKGGIGYTFNNYHAPEGTWGQLVTPDDIRYTYLWGTDLKATNGMAYTDEQIEYFINAGMESIGRTLGIDIKKTKYRYEPKKRNLEKNVDYDKEEALYDFKKSRIARYGLIKTRHKPIIDIHKLSLMNRLESETDLLPSTFIDKDKGVIKFMRRPYRPNETYSGITTAISMYGNETFNNHVFYAIDYDAGFETSDDVPSDLREICAKMTAISMLNVIGDGLMSGFSSSSLSMDGVSESFSSTQSATSAYFGARIAEYKKDVDSYLKENRYRFTNLPMGCL